MELSPLHTVGRRAPRMGGRASDESVSRRGGRKHERVSEPQSCRGGDWETKGPLIKRQGQKMVMVARREDRDASVRRS